MYFEISLVDIPVIFSKFFSQDDASSVVSRLEALNPKRVVFLDTPATSFLRGVVVSLREKGIEVIVRDHHDVPAPKNPRDEEIKAAAQAVRELLGSSAVISDRKTNPACSSLISVGEFVGEGTVLVADPDPDGLTASMKALGISYPELDSDAAVLDGARSEQVEGKLSPLALLLVKGLATLPPYDQNRPESNLKAKAALFAEFSSAASGDAKAREGLESKVAAYEAAVDEAKRLLGKVSEVVTGCVMVDTVGAAKHDLTTLTQGMEAKPGCRVTVVRKDNGPIAAACGGVQYSLAVVKSFQDKINLQTVLPQGFVSSPKSGIISNTSFLLHVNEQVWKEIVLPGLPVILG